MASQHFMLVSKETNRYAAIDAHKVSTGSFHTTKDAWLLPHIESFIVEASIDSLVDPFVGNGDLLRACTSLLPQANQFGYDVAPKNGYKLNDSLVQIPQHTNSLILTNPPYLALHSAKRKRVYEKVKQYYDNSAYNDLYQIALTKCLDAADYVVAIVPETIVNSNFYSSRLVSLTVVEKELFHDTDCPVCVCCFGPQDVPRTKQKVYIGDRFVATFHDLDSCRLHPHKSFELHFNIPSGCLGLRAVDSHYPEKPIAFSPCEHLQYDPSGIKHSSRLMTYIDSPHFKNIDINELSEVANKQLSIFRQNTHDILLSPFKGNRKDGKRRRRLDYRTARAILEISIAEIHGQPTHTLFDCGTDHD